MPFSPEEVARVIIPAAMKRCTMTYKDFGVALGRTDRAPWRGHGKTLYDFQDWLRENQLPPLSLLVVNKQSGRPSSDGYHSGRRFSDMSQEELEGLQEECFAYKWPLSLLTSLGIQPLDGNTGERHGI